MNINTGIDTTVNDIFFNLVDKLDVEQLQELVDTITEALIILQDEEGE